jgi:predicted amidohydrolase
VKTIQQIKNRLIREALDDQSTGWLSDNPDVYLSDDGTALVIDAGSAVEAHIDIDQLAAIVQDIVIEAVKA